MLRTVVLCVSVVLPMFSGTVTVRRGSEVEVRLLNPLGSHSSHRGDPVEAAVIAPAGVVRLQGAVLTGHVEDAEPLGLGVRRGAAELEVAFDQIRLRDGSSARMLARIIQIETSRERVDALGRVWGIDPAMSLSSGCSFLMSTVLVHSELELPMAVVKLLAARSPDSEIRLPAGTEMFVRLTEDAQIDDVSEDGPDSVSFQDAMTVQSSLSRLPLQQAEDAPHRSSDLINIVLLGSKRDVDAAFRAAGWRGETRHSPLALYGMFHSLVQRMGDGTAPMARLRLNGAVATSSYQKSLDTLAKRHHVRLWRQGDSDVWLGAATEDTGFAVRRMRLMHAIDGHIDNERAKVVNDLWFTGCVANASLLRRDHLRALPREDFQMTTDGDVAVVRLSTCNADPGAAPGGRLGLKQAFAAIGSDVVRANPLTVGMATFRMIAAQFRTSPVVLADAPRERSIIAATPVAELGQRGK